MNGLRKLVLINLVILMVLGKVMLLFFNKISYGIRFIDINLNNLECEKSAGKFDQIALNEISQLIINKKSLKEIETMVNKSNDKCGYRAAIEFINEKALLLKKIKMRIFIFVILMVVVVNSIILYYWYINSKQEYREKVNKIYKKHNLNDYFDTSDYKLDALCQENLYEKKNN
jgi:hypothetical protein